MDLCLAPLCKGAPETPFVPTPPGPPMERADGTEGLGKAGGGAESGGLTRVGKSFACFGPGAQCVS